MGQRFEPKYGTESQAVRVTQELSWRSAFRIAWAIVIVNLIVAAIGFAIAVAVGASLFSGLGR